MIRWSFLLSAGTATLAFALAAPAAGQVVEEPAMPVGDTYDGRWGGLYLGAFAGHGWGKVSSEGDPDEFIPDPAGWLLGAGAGVNFTLSDDVVAGVVADIAWSDMSDAVEGDGIFVSTVDWSGSLRGRIGLDAGNFLPYLTAGIAFAHNTIESIGISTIQDEATHVGWTAGAGVEIVATDSLSVDLLYRYTDFGEATYSYIPMRDFELGLTSHQLSVGLNWGF